MLIRSFAHSFLAFDAREESLSDDGELGLKDLIETVLEGVRANNASVVSVQDHAAAPASVIVVEEVVLHHAQGASVVSRRLILHDFREFSFALGQQTVHEILFLLANLELEVVFKQLDHTL